MAALARAYGVDFVPHQTQPSIGHTANLHLVASLTHSHHPAEYNGPYQVQDVVFPHARAARQREVRALRGAGARARARRRRAHEASDPLGVVGARRPVGPTSYGRARERDLT